MRCTHACERMSSTQTLRGFNEITTFMCMRASRRAVVLFTINTLDFVVMVLVLMLTVSVVVGDVCPECLYQPFHIFSERVYVCVCYVLCIQTHFRFKLFNFYYCSWALDIFLCVRVCYFPINVCLFLCSCTRILVPIRFLMPATHNVIASIDYFCICECVRAYVSIRWRYARVNSEFASTMGA